MLVRLTYASIASYGCGHATYRSIIDYSQIANRDLNIGGVIAFDGFQFVQILEGDDTVVYPLFDRILADGRNHGVVCCRQQRPDRRHFRDWGAQVALAVDIFALSDRLADMSAAAVRSRRKTDGRQTASGKFV